MKKIIMLILISACGWVGWVLGEKTGIMTAYFLSCIGGGVGMFLGGKVNRMME